MKSIKRKTMNSRSTVLYKEIKKKNIKNTKGSEKRCKAKTK